MNELYPDLMDAIGVNPWLSVPLQDYEGHMSAPGVAQLNELADLFDEALKYCRPPSVAILGVAGGNGLERVDAGVTTRIVGVDIRQEYLDAVRERYSELPLTLVCADLERDALNVEAVHLVHAALVFEHAGVEGCLRNAVSLVEAKGFLSVVLQLASDVEAGVSATPFASMQSLSGHFRLVSQTELSARLQAAGFTLMRESRRGLPNGKGFWFGLFQR